MMSATFHITPMNKNLLLCAICAFVLGFVSMPTTANDFTLAATATLRDGSILKGTLLTDDIKGAAIFDNSLKLPAANIKSMTFCDTNGNASVTLVNGDSISLEIATPVFELDTILGKLSLVRDKLSSLGISARRIVKPNGLTDGDYCIIDISGGSSATSFPIWYSNVLPEGDEFKTTSIVLKKIPAGSFLMCNQAKVTISKPFFIGVYEVTRRQYQLLEANDAWAKKWWKNGNNPDYPANFITYNMIRGTSAGAQWPASDAVDPGSIIDILRKKTGIKFDLPTEAQWEYACRAGTTSLYNNGGNSESDLQKLGRYRGSGRGLVTVGSYQPNAWGLYDMHGNVFEWCLDWGPWPLANSVDPVGRPNGSNRCLRGGCIDYRADECTADFRYYSYGYPSNESAFFGFRLACPTK